MEIEVYQGDVFHALVVSRTFILSSLYVARESYARCSCEIANISFSKAYGFCTTALTWHVALIIDNKESWMVYNDSRSKEEDKSVPSHVKVSSFGSSWQAKVVAN